MMQFIEITMKSLILSLTYKDYQSFCKDLDIHHKQKLITLYAISNPLEIMSNIRLSLLYGILDNLYILYIKQPKNAEGEI